MVLSHVSTAEAESIRGEFRRLEDTMKTIFWDVTWTAYRIDRPTGTWDAGTESEEWEAVASGTGRLSENGAGGPVQGETVISIESPYRLRTDADAFDAFRTPDGSNSDHDVSTAWLVIDNSRLFKVDSFKPRSGERQHANAYISEVFDRALPAVTP